MMKMNKLLYWIFKILSIILLIPAGIIAIPGLCFYLLSEEYEDYDINNEMKKHEQLR